MRVRAISFLLFLSQITICRYKAPVQTELFFRMVRVHSNSFKWFNADSLNPYLYRHDIQYWGNRHHIRSNPSINRPLCPSKKKSHLHLPNPTETNRLFTTDKVTEWRPRPTDGRGIWKSCFPPPDKAGERLCHVASHPTAARTIASAAEDDVNQSKWDHRDSYQQLAFSSGGSSRLKQQYGASWKGNALKVPLTFTLWGVHSVVMFC